jgi:2-dehydro-3-deoxygalactonokinase
MGTLASDGYEPALLKLAGSFLPKNPEKPVPVIVCGMAGAKQGWTEAAYRAVPCKPVAEGQMAQVPTRDPRLSVSIVPGLCQTKPANVMRGEETQLAGLVSRLGAIDATVCMPGTHSKWVRLEAGQVASFATFMTGELFAVIAAHSILRKTIAAQGEDREAYLGAVSEMLDDPGGLTGALFSIRAGALLAGLDGAAARSRLSGLLIGAELAASRAQWERRAVHLVGAGSLTAAYSIALESAGAKPVQEDAEALTLAGLAQVRGPMSRTMLRDTPQRLSRRLSERT